MMRSLSFHFIPLTLFLMLSACENEAPDTGNPIAAIDSNIDSLQLTAEDAQAIRLLLESYLQQIDADYSEVSTLLTELNNGINDFLQTPSESSLQTLKRSWIAAHNSYEITAIHRYFADDVMADEQALQFYQLQYLLNHWPILPGYLDYVSNYPDSGMVNDMTVSLDPLNLRQQHGAFDINEAAVGFHVIEFLLWGENALLQAPRPYQDYLPELEPTAEQQADGIEVAQLSNNRRRRFLAATGAALREDFQTLTSLWSAGSTDMHLSLSEQDPTTLLLPILNATTSMLTEEILVRTLYPMLNGDFEESLPSPYSGTSQNVASAYMTALERLLLEVGPQNSANLDEILSKLSNEYAEFFFQNFDASKECLVVLYSSEPGVVDSAETEFKVVECINFLTNMIDYLEQIKFTIAAPV